MCMLVVCTIVREEEEIVFDERSFGTGRDEEVLYVESGSWVRDQRSEGVW